MDVMSVVIMVLLTVLLAMSLVAFGVHLARSVREFRAGYDEAGQQLTV